MNTTNRDARGRKPRALTDRSYLGRIGARLRERRLALGMTMGSLSDRMRGKISSDSISNYERGADPGIDGFLRLCQGLQAAPAQLLPEDILALFRLRRYDPDRLARILEG